MGPSMTINLTIPDIQELKPRITVFGVGGAGGNAVNNMIASGLNGVDFVCANTDAQALALSQVRSGSSSSASRLPKVSAPGRIRKSAGRPPKKASTRSTTTCPARIWCSSPRAWAAAPAPARRRSIARAAREQGILTVGVVTKPFTFEGNRRARLAEDGIDELHRHVDTLIVIPNQNLFRVANEKTTFADAFKMADQVLYSGVACITDLMVKEGLINLDFADVRAVMRGMGKAMMGTGEASGEDRARHAAEAAIANPLLDDVSMQGARGLLISITGGPDLTLYEVDEAASRIREEVDADANIILGATYDPDMTGTIRVSVVATGTDATMVQALEPVKANTTRAPLQASRFAVPSSRRRHSSLPAARSDSAVRSRGRAGRRRGDHLPGVDAGQLSGRRHHRRALHSDGRSPSISRSPSRPIEQPIPSVYVPSHAERPEGQRRMPRTEELPAVARRSLAAEERHDPEPRNARALFKRLASNVGLGLRPQQHPGLDETHYTALTMPRRGVR